MCPKYNSKTMLNFNFQVKNSHIWCIIFDIFENYLHYSQAVQIFKILLNRFPLITSLLRSYWYHIEMYIGSTTRDVNQVYN